MLIHAYAVAKKATPQEQRDLIYVGMSTDNAKNKVRQAIASGYDYGYIKDGFETVAYLTESSFLVTVK